MQYETLGVETGPDIRYNDWRPYEGDTVYAGGCLQVHAAPAAHVINEYCRIGGGGELEYELRFVIDRIDADGQVSFCINRRYGNRILDPTEVVPNPQAVQGDDPGFRLEVRLGRARLLRGGRELWGREVDENWLDAPHRLKVATVLWRYLVELDGQELAAGDWDPAAPINEGRTAIVAENAQVTVTDYAQRFIRRRAEYPDWRRGELLYEESFGPSSFDAHWITNGQAPTVDAEGFTFHNMSNSFLRRRFDGPLAVECVATPQPTPKWTSRCTDAIFLWMADHPEQDFIDEYLPNLPDAGLKNLVPLPLYWVDFGGSNNVTTRLRRNPERVLIRQFSDRGHLLDPGASYRVTTVQNGDVAEFWVDGQRWIQFADPQPFTSGFVGFRAYLAGIRVTELKVWRIS